MKTFSNYNNVWVEFTKSEHGHGGPGWEFGTCLWSPSTDRAGGDRYAIMREPKVGDLVLHFYNDTWSDGSTETRLTGESFVAREHQTIFSEPPTPGPWESFDSYYRVDLVSYTPFPAPVSFGVFRDIYASEILRLINEGRPRHFPFNTYGQTVRPVQGLYLGRCPDQLYLLFLNALGISQAADNDGQPAEASHREYAEGLRIARESHFFSRSPQLAAAAKKHHSFICQACGFNFEATYGPLGIRYAECHHLKPLSERPESEWGRITLNALSDVTVLCANCHRMIHRRRPALSLTQLIETIQPSGLSHRLELA